MSKAKIQLSLKNVLKPGITFDLEAYQFLMEALTYTVSKLEAPRHVSGQELIEGVGRYASAQFGPMALRVLNYWGIYNAYDFGIIVYDLIDANILKRQSTDTIEDFQTRLSLKEILKKNDLFGDDV